MNLEGSIQPWLVSADDGSLSDAIKLQDPQGTLTMPKPELQSEQRGLGKITAASLLIFGQEQETAPTTISQTYLPEVIHWACRNREKFGQEEQEEQTTTMQ